MYSGTIATDDGIGCMEVNTNQTVEFEVTIELKECTEDMKNGLVRSVSEQIDRVACPNQNN